MSGLQAIIAGKGDTKGYIKSAAARYMDYFDTHSGFGRKRREGGNNYLDKAEGKKFYQQVYIDIFDELKKPQDKEAYKRFWDNNDKQFMDGRLSERNVVSIIGEMIEDT